MDYEKKYNDALKKAMEWKKKYILTNTISPDGTMAKEFKEIFPELSESEDERIRKVIYKLILGMREEIFTAQDEIVTKEKALAYLEKKPDIKIWPHPIKDVYLERKEQKPSWSEEDKRMLLSIINAFRNGTVSTIGQEQWLKSLPERFNLRPKPEWRVEDGVLYLSNVFVEETSRNKQEWSKEDEKMKERLITRLNWITYNTRTDGTSPNITFFDEINWLKSLRPPQYCENCRLKKSVQGWKPSEEQMDALRVTLEYMPDTFKPRCTLMTLQNDLEKLM